MNLAPIRFSRKLIDAEAGMTMLKSIIEKYNRRLEEVETDMSLRIELQ